MVYRILHPLLRVNEIWRNGGREGGFICSLPPFQKEIQWGNHQEVAPTPNDSFPAHGHSVFLIKQGNMYEMMTQWITGPLVSNKGAILDGCTLRSTLQQHSKKKMVYCNS